MKIKDKADFFYYLFKFKKWTWNCNPVIHWRKATECYF